MIFGFKPYQSVGFQFDGVTRDKKIILINSRLLNVDFFSTNAPTSRRIPTVMCKI